MLPQRIKKLLSEYKQNHLWRERKIVSGTSTLNFCSNDYLQLAHHDLVKKSFADGAYQYGLGSTGSPLVSGYSNAHQQLEEAYADFLQRDQALLFSSGYHANLGVLTTLANHDTVIIADKYCHASLSDGALLSRAKYLRFQHNSMAHAERLLQKNSGTKELMLMTDSVFSINGNCAKVPHLAGLAKQYGALLLVDDAHGLGTLGKRGAGVCDEWQLNQQDVPYLMTPLGKAGASMGAIVTGSNTLLEPIMQFTRTYRYSTALPPAMCIATLTALTILKTETWRREKLRYLIAYFLQAAQQLQLPLLGIDRTPIKSILIKNNLLALSIQQQLASEGMLVACMRPPTVPKQATCLRITLNCQHSETDINRLLDRLAEKLC